MRKNFIMTQEDYDGILKRINLARNTPLVCLQAGMPQSPQEAANSAWSDLGKRMGFDAMTVLAAGDNPLQFSAVEL